MKKHIVLFCCIFMCIKLYAQKKSHVPAPPLPSKPSTHQLPLPPAPVYDYETHQEIINDVNKVVKEFQRINTDTTLGRIETNDTVNRNMAGSFPSVFLLVKVSHPDKPSENHTSRAYVMDYSIGSDKVYDLEKKNKYDDYRTIYDFKIGTITGLHTDKSGAKKAGKFAFSTINLAPDGTSKALNVNPENGAVSIFECEEYKTISGYNCRKYKKEDETGTLEVWTTLDSGIYAPQLTDPLLKAFFCVSVPITNTFGDYKSVLKGVPVQLVYLPKNKFSMKCIVTYEKIEKGKTDQAMFSTSGYNVIELHSLQEIFKSRD